MGKWVLLISLFLSQGALALPVLNENVSVSDYVTVYPDHKDPNRYYVAPSVMVIARDSNGVPTFSYQEYKKSLFETFAIVQMTLTTGFINEEISRAVKSVRSHNAKALFSGVAFTSSKLNFTNTDMSELIVSSNCDHIGGVVGSEQACSFLLNPMGRKIFRKNILDSTAIVLHFEFTINGVLNDGYKGFSPYEGRFGIAARIGGDGLREYPMLFRDSNGDPIKF